MSLPKPPRGSLRSENGFSFLEMAAALLVIALVSAVLTSSLNLGLKALHRVANPEGASDQVYVAQKALRRLLEAIRPLPLDVMQHGGPLWFAGRSNSLRFITQVPPRLGLGGYYAVTIATRTATSGLKELTVLPAIVGPRMRDWPAAESSADDETVILENIAGLTLRYFGDPDGGKAPVWANTWEGRSYLPLLIAIDIAYPRNDPRHWPTLLVTPVFGGGARL